MTSLAELRCGQRCRVGSIDYEDPHLVARIRRLGFAPGAEVEVQGKAPFGDPVVYRVSGTSICLRNAQSRHITVEQVV